MRFQASEAATATGGTLVGADVVLDGVSFDSRSVRPGQLFVPIVADRDGHDFVADAIARGAAASLSARPIGSAAPVIEVADTAAAFLDLAAWARARFPERVVGITGSVGKTSVKDLTAAVLRTTFRTAANERSYNNDQGLPHTMLNAPDDSDVLVVEMGMRGFGEIARLCRVARPTIGVVTAVAEAHTERLGGIEGVARAKGELIESLPASGTAVLNADQPLVASMAARSAARVLSFGLAGEVRVSDLRLDELARPRFVLDTPWGSGGVALSVSGAHMALNAAAAAAVGLVLGVELGAVCEALAGATLSPWRMELRRTAAGLLVLNDAYNANPSSMRAALDALAALDASVRVAVLGVMAEISDPDAEHLAIAEYAAARGIELMPVGTELYGRDPVTDAIDRLRSLPGDSALLIKGSRVAGLEHLAAALHA